MKRARLRNPAILIALGLVSCCQACTVWEFGRGGLASGINLLYLLYPIFEGTNGTFYLDNSKNPYSCSETGTWQNGWHDFFKAPGVLNWKQSDEQTLGKVCRRLSDAKEVMDILQKVGLDYAELQTESATKLWNFQPWIRARIDYELKEVKRFQRPTIGFHIRGGDKFEEDRVENRVKTMPKDLVQTFKNTYPGVKGGTCVVVGDDAALVAELKELANADLGCKIYSPRAYHKKEGHFQPQFITMDLTSRCAATIQVLTDIEMLAHTDFFIGSYNSGMVGLIEILRYALYGKSRYTFADASAQHRDWYSNIRRFMSRKSHFLH
eukprot:jgi/Botrbrau1/2100/Bobra.0093s0008.1